MCYNTVVIYPFAKCANYAKSVNQWNESKQAIQKALKQGVYRHALEHEASKRFIEGAICITGGERLIKMYEHDLHAYNVLLCTLKPAKPRSSIPPARVKAL